MCELIKYLSSLNHGLLSFLIKSIIIDTKLMFPLILYPIPLKPIQHDMKGVKYILHDFPEPIHQAI